MKTFGGDQIANSSYDCSPSKEESLAYPVEGQPENSENGNGRNNAAKKPAWNKPSNGAGEVSPVMGAESWPPLSESNRASPKSIRDGSAPLLQGTGIASSSSHKQVITDNANPNTTSNHVGPTRQMSMKRVGAGSISSLSTNGGLPQSPPHAVETSPNTFIKPGTMEVNVNFSGQRGNFGSQPGNDHQQPPPHSSFRRNNDHQQPPHSSFRRSNSHHGYHGYGGRRDQHRGNNPHRGNRDARMQAQQPQPVVHIPPLHISTPFSPPLVPIPPFGHPMGYPGFPPDTRAMSNFGPMSSQPSFPIPSQSFPIPDLPLHAKLLNQIDYYFSNENLIKDTFLRKEMDDRGWVPVKLIAGFTKVKLLTDKIQVILDALRPSTVVEVQGDKVRKRNDWMRWIMPQGQFSSPSSLRFLGRSNSDNTLATHIRSLSFGELSCQTHRSGSSESHPSGSETDPSLPSGSEGTGQVNIKDGTERSTSMEDSSK